MRFGFNLLTIWLAIISGSNSGFCQIIMHPGSALFVSENTQVRLLSLSDSVQLFPSSQVINNGIITLENGAKILEPINNPITGTGQEISFVKIQNLDSLNPGNLGITILPSQIGDSIKVTRSHQDILSPVTTGIKRSFSISNLSSTIAHSVVKMFFDPSEYNGSFSNNLLMHHISIDTIVFQSIQPIANTLSFHIDSMGTFTAGEYRLSLTAEFQSGNCGGDSIYVSFDYFGYPNTSNTSLVLTNGIDSTIFVNINSPFGIPISANLISDQVFSVFAVGTFPLVQSNSLNNYLFHPLPLIDTSQVINAICVNSEPAPLSFLPSGGVLSGFGLMDSLFSPALAGIGNAIINYSYTDFNGCSISINKLIQINDKPVLHFPYLDSICINNVSLLLDQATPIGGSYFGAGVQSNLFFPGQANLGLNDIFYTYTDFNGCSDTIQTEIKVLSLPNVTATMFGPFCTNDMLFPIPNGIPSGGIYFGNGVISNTFYPSLSNPGTNDVIYEFQDSLGCTNSDTIQIIVFETPITPTISINFNTLTTSTFSSYQWYQNGLLIPNENSQFITANTNGFYQVEVTNSNGCSSLSDPFNYVYSDISDSYLSELIIFPNPFSSEINISNSFHISSTQIFNSIGSIVFSSLEVNSKKIINLEHLEPGIYYIKFTLNNGKTINQSIVKL